MIYYKVGDATQPCVEGDIRVIVHICNDAGKWGAGFSKALSARWKEPEEYYKSQRKFAKNRCLLGQIQWIFPEVRLGVANMIAQEGTRSVLNPRPIRYESLELCLNRLAAGCHAAMREQKKGLTLHMPRIGCGLAGGNWDAVGSLVAEALWDFDVYVYDLP